MTEVIVHRLVATSPGGDVAPSTAVKNELGGTGSGQELLTYVENDKRTSCSSFSATSLSATWHCDVRANLLAGADDVALPRHACCAGGCRALVGGGWLSAGWLVMVVGKVVVKDDGGGC